MRNRSWCFTLNNPREDFSLDYDQVRYSVYQLERGANGTEHIQGYVSFRTPKSFPFCQAYVPGAHWEVRRGTEEEASAYCSKEQGRISEPVVHGRIAEPGKRTDLDSAIVTLRETLSLKRVAEEHPSVYVKFSRGLRDLQRIMVSPTKPTTDVCFIFGPTGSGKSHFLRSEYPKGYWKQNSLWWDDYEGESTVIVDEFYGWLPFSELLRLCDKYPLLVQTKGGQVRAKFRRIFFTSNTMLDKMYDFSKHGINWAPLVRRFTSFMYFKSLLEHFYYDDWTSFKESVRV